MNVRSFSSIFVSYPSITENLLMAAIKLAKNDCPISDREINILKQTQTLVLFHNDCPWTKRNNPEFNITMGILLLWRLRFMFDIKDTGLYRDGGVISLRKTNPHNIDRLRKERIKI